MIWCGLLVAAYFVREKWQFWCLGVQEELGDLLFQVVFHAVLAEERGSFTLAEVAKGIHDKLYVRHPHVFGDAPATTVDQLAVDWEQRKVLEKGRERDGRHPCGPASAALRGEDPEEGRIAGVDWRTCRRRALEMRLLDLVDEARTAGVDPEAALRWRRRLSASPAPRDDREAPSRAAFAAVGCATSSSSSHRSTLRPTSHTRPAGSHQ